MPDWSVEYIYSIRNIKITKTDTMKINYKTKIKYFYCSSYYENKVYFTQSLIRVMVHK